MLQQIVAVLGVSCQWTHVIRATAKQPQLLAEILIFLQLGHPLALFCSNCTLAVIGQLVSNTHTRTATPSRLYLLESYLLASRSLARAFLEHKHQDNERH